MKPTPSIARHRADSPDPLGFDALRLQAITAAQDASGELWTDYNLHDPGVSLLEALCFALTEDLFAARQPVPQLLGLDSQTDPRAWARFGLHTAQLLLPCHPCTEQDWQLWLLQQLPHARQLHMQPLRDAHGHGSGLWRIALQADSDALPARQALVREVLQAYWPQRSLCEDLASPPQALRPRWVELELSLLLEGHRDICELLAEVLQRCDDCISARLPEGLPALAGAAPHVEGPLSRALTPAEAQWLDRDPDFLFVSDLARHLQGVDGLAAVDTLRLRPAADLEELARTSDAGQTDAHSGIDLHPEPQPPLQPDVHPLQPAVSSDDTVPPGAVRRRGSDWALRLRWPEHEHQLRHWRLVRAGTAEQLPAQALLQLLADRRRLPLRLSPAPAVDLSGGGRQAVALPDLPPLRCAHDAATAALPPLYHQALLDHARQQPGLRAQWQGYAGLLEQALNHAQAQREQLPRLYALDDEGTRSNWLALPGDEQLSGISGLYLQPPEQLEAAAWADEDALSRRQRVLDTQLALHGEALDHAGLHGLPCYFSPRAWPVHLLRLKRRFARRLLRLGGRRSVAADFSRPLLGQPDNTPPLQERLGLMLGLAQTHSRLLSRSWQAQGLPAPYEEPGTGAEGYDSHAGRPPPQQPPADALPLLDPAAPRRAPGWPALRQALPPLRGSLPAPLLRAAVQPARFQWAPGGGELWLGPDESGHHWRLAGGLDEAQAQAHARALHESACQLQAAGEGLHLVEHLLLRPLTGTASLAAAEPVQISLVFSGWTARCADARFRTLAAESVTREAPAHLRCRLLWLNANQMQDFEAAWQAWLTARQVYCRALLADPDTDRAAPDAPPRTQPEATHLDAQSARLRALLQGWGEP